MEGREEEGIKEERKKKQTSKLLPSSRWWLDFNKFQNFHY